MASIKLLLKSGKYELLLAAKENREDYKLVDAGTGGDRYLFHGITKSVIINS